ncbi:MAG: hypothetical protein ACRCVN_04050 [Spirochaetia bacterium]
MNKLVLFLLLLASLISCASKKPVYETEVTIERYFRYAQTARNKGNNTLAMQYYDLIIKNFGGRPDKVIIAQYEKGSLFHAKKQYKKAVELFDTVLASANDARVASAIPPAVLYLARTLKKEAEEQLQKKGKLLDAN